MFDEGHLTDSHGRKVDFRSTIIIMTSNMGSHEIQAAFESNEAYNTAEKVAKEKVMELLKALVRPEFLNRIDDIVLFSPLTRKEIRQIVSLQLSQIQKKSQANR